MAESVSEAKVVAELRRLHSTGTIVLVIPQTVREEFDRNKNLAASKYYQRHHGIINSARALRHIEGAPPEIVATLESCRRALEQAKRVIPNSIAAIDNLFSSLTISETTDGQRLSAFRRLYERKPPGYSPKYSTPGDCLIWECVVDHIRRGDVAFCTANKSDFSNPKDERELHPDLTREVKADKCLTQTACMIASPDNRHKVGAC
jgi:PIN domain